jgi:hypothetical protein
MRLLPRFVVIFFFAVTLSLRAQCVLNQVEDKTTFPSVTAADETDFDHDGTTDVALAYTTPLFYRGVPGGGFEDSKSFGDQGLEQLALGDFNGDGNMDVVTAGGSRVWINLGDGKGGFAAKLSVYPAIQRVRGIVTGRFSGPGSNTDVLVFDENQTILT